MLTETPSKPVFFSLLAVLTAAVIGAAILLSAPRTVDDTDIPRTIQTGSNDIPDISTQTMIEDLDHPWDMIMFPDGSLIFSERANKLTYWSAGEATSLPVPDDTYVQGEGGMLGLALDPLFEENSYIYTCFNSTKDDLDVRVARWTFDYEEKILTDRTDIVTGLPSNQSGRHSGCQLEFGPDGYLWIGTGDAADSNNPQDTASLGGKILRVNRDGSAAPRNIDHPPYEPRIYSYGHRNVQGLGFFDPGKVPDLIGISIEHGPSQDDEVNLLLKGNFGWDPLPNYGEGVPMTDLDKYPDAIEALWSSGNPTIATSGGTVIQGEQWLAWDQAIAVAGLKSTKVVILELDEDREIARQTELFQADYGRIRTVQQGTDGNLYLLTDNGSGKDKIIQVSPI